MIGAQLALDPGTDRRGLARADHQGTAKAAAVAVFPRSGSLRKKVLGAVWRAGQHGATRDELAASLDMGPNTLRPRVKELIDGEWVEASGRTRPSDSGRASEVLVLTLHAQAEIARRIGR